MTITPNPLRNFWHVVALSSDVQDQPVPTMLLNEQLVLWRSKDGVHAIEDICIHRGTRLSLGWVEGDDVVCPYHGWQYGATGAVTRIPALPPERPIPSKASVPGFLCEERYGLVFVCLGEPARPIPEVPELDRDDFKTHLLGPVVWRTSAERSLENFMDETHLPWVHPEMLGNRDNVPVVEVREVHETDGEFYFECESEVRNRLDPGKMTLNRLTYRITLPYSLLHENIYPNGDRVVDLFFSTPVSDQECARYMVVGRNFALDQPAEKFIAFTTKVWEQDRAIIESQRPMALPVDWDSELHMRGLDSPSISYRRMMRQLGVANPQH
jgi:vanillate O-demethylase monooxygenase subunit